VTRGAGDEGDGPVRHDERHRAREAALQILYQADVARTDVAVAVDTVFDLQWPGPTPASQDIRAFASELAHDTRRRLPAIDELIAETARRWRPERMPIIDHLVLRMGVCELLRQDGTPAPVVINEALELARTFSTEESVKFINGMLDGIRKKIEAQDSGSRR
jgi:N utilization substance protein B